MTYDWTTASGTHNDAFVSDEGIENLIFVLGLCQALTSSFILCLFLMVQVPPAYSRLQNVVLVVVTTMVPYYFLYTALAVAGVMRVYLAFTFHLLDVIVRDPTTRDVINAVVYPANQLLMTLRLMVCIVFIFTYIIFIAFPDDFIDDECNHLGTCFIATLNGLRATAGVGEDLKTYYPGQDMGKWFLRGFVFDMTYFVIVNIVLINVIFGIIIDTFGELRVQKNFKNEDMKNMCFICNLDRNRFERAGVVFNKHIWDQHCMWSYLKFVLHVYTKDTSEFNGLEQYVHQCLQQKTIDWFPVNRAMVLLSSGDREDEENARFEELKLKIERTSEQLGKLRDTVTTRLRAPVSSGVKVIQDMLPEWEQMKTTVQMTLRYIEDEAALDDLSDEDDIAFGSKR